MASYEMSCNIAESLDHYKNIIVVDFGANYIIFKENKLSDIYDSEKNSMIVL